MSTLHKKFDGSHLTEATSGSDQPTEDNAEERRARRMAALRNIAGIWADRADIPADGLEYQRELRGTWH